MEAEKKFLILCHMEYVLFVEAVSHLQNCALCILG
jgi:hypothetical protein